MDNNDYLNAHKYCSNHGDKLKNDRICGCFYCLKIFSPESVELWVRHRKPMTKSNSGSIDEWVYDENETAFCPYCGVDSVIGESSGYPITQEFLIGMKHYWFGR